MDVTVCIGTFGDRSWAELARTRAIPSVEAEGVEWVHVHADTLQAARNGALEEVDTEWVIHLDADDELAPGYIEAMAKGTADVRGPMVRFVVGARERMWQPRVAGHKHDCSADCLPAGNWLIVGSAVRAAEVRRAGGWNDWPVYEDWDLFLRLFRQGASFELVRDAVYKAHVRTDSRNRGPSMEFKNRVHRQILESLPFNPGGVVPAPGGEYVARKGETCL